MKKNILVAVISLLVSYCGFSQSIGIGTDAPHPSAAVHITYPFKGVLLPVMTTQSMNAINNPASGLLVYDSTTRQLMVNTGTPVARLWQNIVAGGAWTTRGNGGINAGTSFIGTTDNQPLFFRGNNTRLGELFPASGNIRWGANTVAPLVADPAYSNIAIGTDALKGAYGRGRLVAIGDSALLNNGRLAQVNTEAILNTAIGSKAMYNNIRGSLNTAIGYESLFRSQDGSGNTAIGTEALYSSWLGAQNTAFGYRALYYNTIGNFNTAIGSSIQSNTEGNANTSIGFYGLSANTIGSNNTAAGKMALATNINGHSNTAVGYQSLTHNTSGLWNTAVGPNALFYNNGYSNTAIGSVSMASNSEGNNNTSIGGNALFHNTTGSDNTAIGNAALYDNTAGHRNTAIGLQALIKTTVSQNNTAIGYAAAWHHNLGWNNTLIGAKSDMSAAGIFNSVVIGESAVADANSRVRIGNSATNSIVGQVGYSTQSDGRFKKNVQANIPGTAFIMKLRPVTYQLDIAALNKRWNTTRENDISWAKAVATQEETIFSGFIAQEVEQAAKELGYSFSGVDKPAGDAVYALRYAEFVMPLVKAMQERQKLINELNIEAAALKKEHSEQNDLQTQLLQRIEALEKTILPKN